MKFHPFCGGKITSKLKMLIAFDMIVSAIVLQIAIIGLFFKFGVHYEMISTNSKDSAVLGADLSTMVIFVMFLVIDMMLDVWLWIIVPKKNKNYVQTWFIMKITLELCDAVGFSVEVICGRHTAIYITPMLLDFLFTAFFLWAVYVFMMEINKTSKTILEGNKFVKFFKNGGNHRNSGVGGGRDEESALKSVLDD